MASANVPRFVKDVENMCECNICFVEYDENKHVPRVLPCHHTFCTECLSKHCKEQTLKCPLCNREHFAKNGDVKTFPKDNTRRDLKELLDRFMQSLCGVCRRHDHVKYFCITCNIRICSECYKEKKSSDCNTHDFEMPGDSSMTQDTSLKSIYNQSKARCLLPGHEHNELKFYCTERQCCKPVCANCIVEKHKEHVCCSIEDRYVDCKKALQYTCHATKSKIARTKKLLENVEKEITSLPVNEKKGQESLTAEANRGIRYIQDYVENTKKKMKETSQKTLAILKKKQQKMQYFIDNASECCAISEEALRENNCVKFLSVEKTLTEKLNGFKQSEVDRPLDPILRENVELRRPILELNERINRMTTDDEETAE
ncbi:E3 ubiquitin-protein ligase Midline-1-like [Saccostrea echinata]|uniref:E3 ubiquitin-protein ligase Midline-1-like n=1 Tax=Saccostrea echinata TaxID=191078 RepID=UPI002A80E2AF|nr:E3 ubiquitin-protein ligase Midline-1-like [Saccostrea echinata]